MVRLVGNNLFEQTASLEEMHDYCKKLDLVGIDIETGRKFIKNRYSEVHYQPGLDPFLSRIIMIQIGNLENQFIIDARQFSKELLVKYLKPILENENILKIGHNLKFEGKFFLHLLDIELINVWDTMICERILYNGYLHSYSLAALMNRYFGIKSTEDINLFKVSPDDIEDVNMYVDKSTRLQFINIGDKPFTKKQIEYGADDIIYPIKIYQIQKKGRVVDGELWKPTKAFLLENTFTQILARIELVGMPFDQVKWLELYETNLKIYIERKTALDCYISHNYPAFTDGIDLFNQEKTCAIQWSSSKQVIKFFKSLGICPKERSKQTKRMEYTVGAKAMFKLLEKPFKIKFYKKQFPKTIESYQDLILAYVLLKKSEQLITTFGKDFLKYVHPITKRVHSNYNQFMNTGRLSSTRPNLQNIPSDAVFRKCFTEDSLFANADFSGQESRVLAYVSQVPALVDFFVNGHEIFGTDLHSYAATLMYRKLLDEEDLIVTKKSDPDKRTNAKSFNFKLPLVGKISYIMQKVA